MEVCFCCHMERMKNSGTLPDEFVETIDANNGSKYLLRKISYY